MKKSLTLMAFCGLFAASTSAQIIQSVNPDTPIWGVTENTGIAIAPFYHWNAVVYDDPAGDYWIQWRDANTSALLDIDNQPGSNPDVAYYANADAVVVTYENGGGVWVDDYYLNTVVPVNYNLNVNTGIAGGLNPNIDMNSLGDGVLTWEDWGGTIWMCAFQIGPFTPGPLVPVAAVGSMPDVALMDHSKELVLTYEQSGQLVIETYDYAVLQAGGAAMTTPPVTIPTSGAGWEWPRVQANRNQMFGGPDLYTVVAQDNMGGMYDAWGFFFMGSGTLVGNSMVNAGINFCAPSFPRPVVAYDRDEVHVAFAQDYWCALPPGDPMAQDVLMVHYDHAGNHVGPTPPGVFLEVNNFDLPFEFSATSLNTEYDGNYMITPTNYCEGVAFNDPGDLFWKIRDVGTPAWRQAEPGKLTVDISKGVMSNFVTVEVSILDEVITENEVEMEFAVYDQSGRLVEVPTFEKEGMVYRIDVTNLEQGIYLLQYTLNGETKAERIPHFTN